MIKISKSQSPKALEDLRISAVEKGLNAGEAYNTLQNPLKSEVKELLMREQGHLCAYCMRRIPDERKLPEGVPNVIIEHWTPRNPLSFDGVAGALDYTNMLAVCSGNQGDRTSKRKSRLTCDAKRDNRLLKVNPLDQSTLDTIYYEVSGKIKSSDIKIDNDLDVILNLNCQVDTVRLPESRKQAVAAIEENIAMLDDEEILTYSKRILANFENETDPKTPYIGIIIWWLKDFIKSMEG